MEFSRQKHWSVAFPFSRGSSQPRKSNRRLLHCRQILYSLRHQGREAIGHPLQYSCLENPLDRGAWWATIYGVTQSRTRLKRLSSSSKATREALVIPWPWGYFGGGRGMDTLPPEHPGEALGQMPAMQVGTCVHLLGRVLTAWGRGKVHLWARDPSYSW